MANLFLNLPAPAADGSGAAVDTSLQGAIKTITVRGNGGVFEPSVLVEFSNDPAAIEWSPLTFFGIPGERTVTCVARWMRATVQNYKGGGAPTVDVGADVGAPTFATVVGPTGNGAGAGVDVSADGLLKTVQVVGTYRGACNVEISNDGGTQWSQALSFPNPNSRTLALAAEFMRISRSGVPEVAPGQPTAYVGMIEFGSGGGGETASGIVFGQEDIGGIADTRYIPPGSRDGVASTVNRFEIVAPRDGTLRNLSVIHNTADPATVNFVNVNYTILINGAPTALTASIATSQFFTAQATDTSNEVAVTAGQRIALQCVKTGQIDSGVFNVVAYVEF